MKKRSAFAFAIPYLVAIIAMLILFVSFTVYLIRQIEANKKAAQKMSEKTKQKVNLRSKQ